MKYRKMMPVLEDNRSKSRSKKGKKKHGDKHRRVTIPVEIRKFVNVNKGDWIEWEVDTKKKTLRGKLIKNDTKRK